jgi:hypothetical protein
MKHRHLTDEDPWSPAAIDDMLDRGLPEDWVALRDRIDVDPHGEIAETVKRLCAATHRYGTSFLWSSYVDEARKHGFK